MTNPAIPSKRAQPVLGRKQALAALERARSCLRRGDRTAAVPDLEAAYHSLKEHEIKQQLVQVYLEGGLEAAAGSHSTEARELLEKAWALLPGHTGLAPALGRLCWTQGDWARASAVFDQLLAADPQPATVLALVVLRVRQGRLEPAEALLAKVDRAHLPSPELVKAYELAKLARIVADPDRSRLVAACGAAPQVDVVRGLSQVVATEHEALARSFAQAVEETAREELYAVRQALAASLAAGPREAAGDPVADLAARLAARLQVSFDTLAQQVRASLAPVVEVFREDWGLVAARVAAALACADGARAKAELPRMPEECPEGVYLVLETLAHLAEGELIHALSRLGGAGVGSVPPATLLALLGAILERTDPGDLPLPVLRAVAAQGSGLPPAPRRRLAEALFRQGEIERALDLLKTLRPLPVALAKLSAVGQEWLGEEEAAFQTWQEILKEWREDDPEPPAPWFLSAAVHAAGLARLQGHPEWAAELLRKALARRPTSPELTLAWIRHLKARGLQAELARLPGTIRRWAPGESDRSLTLIHAHLAAGQVAEAWEEAASAIVREPGPELAELFGEVALERSKLAPTDEAAAQLLADAARLSPPDAWRQFVQAAILAKVDPSAGEELCDRALEAAKGQPAAALKIALTMMKRGQMDMGLGVLRNIDDTSSLGPRQAAEITAGFMTLGDQEAAGRWLAGRLDRPLRDDERVGFLCLLYLSLTQAHGRPDLARGLVGVAQQLTPVDKRLQTALHAAAGEGEDKAAGLERLLRFRTQVDEGAYRIRFPPFWDPFKVLQIERNALPAQVKEAAERAVRVAGTEGPSAAVLLAQECLGTAAGRREAHLFTPDPTAPTAPAQPIPAVLVECLLHLAGRDLGLEFPIAETEAR